MTATRTQLVASLLSIDNIEENIYRSVGEHIGNLLGPKRVFGGYVAAQVYKAVYEYKKKTLDENPIFSMHYNFLDAGDPEKLIDIKINQMENIYAVDVYHENRTIGLAHIKTEENLLESPSFPADVPGLLNILSMSELISLMPTKKIQKQLKFLADNFVFEIRPVHMITSPGPGDHRVIFYARLIPECIDQVKEGSGMVAVVALSDFFVMQSATNAMKESGFRMAAGGSMHHKIHFHQKSVEPIQWFLVETRTEIAAKNKAKIFGTVFDSNKNCVVSFIQEAYVVPEKIESKI